jgi:hypothetical protein
VQRLSKPVCGANLIKQIPPRPQQAWKSTWHYWYSKTSTVPSSVWVKRLLCAKAVQAGLRSEFAQGHIWFGQSHGTIGIQKPHTDPILIWVHQLCLVLWLLEPVCVLSAGIWNASTGGMYPFRQSAWWLECFQLSRALVSSPRGFAEKFCVTRQHRVDRFCGTKTVSVCCKMVGNIPPPWRIGVFMLLCKCPSWKENSARIAHRARSALSAMCG